MAKPGGVRSYQMIVAKMAEKGFCKLMFFCHFLFYHKPAHSCHSCTVFESDTVFESSNKQQMFSPGTYFFFTTKGPFGTTMFCEVAL